MQIVIDIPNSTFTDLKKKAKSNKSRCCCLERYTTLKTHGRLIDADELKKNAYSASAFTQVVDVSDIDNAHTILEGTK